MLNLGSGSASPVRRQQVGSAAAQSRAAAGPAGCRVEPAAPRPSNRAPTDMEPTEALFDAINRGDIATARDAISRGADLHGHNILGMTPLELSVDLGRNDISFMLLSMRAADDGRRRAGAGGARQRRSGRRRSRRNRRRRIRRRGSPHQRRPPRRPPGCSAATAARRTRMPASWGSIPAGADGREIHPADAPAIGTASVAPHMADQAIAA